MQRGLGSAGRRVWVETDAPCEVEVLGRRAPTFTVEGHHVGLVELTDLEPGTDTELQVRLDGERVWPDPDDPRPAPRIRAVDPGRPVRLVVGSCRQAAPPSWLDQVESERPPPGIGTDALAALAREVAVDGRPAPDGLVLLGDQVYADEPDPRTVDALRRRRGGPPRPDHPEVTSFEEYTWLYQEAWSEPWIRWLLAAVPSVMVFDDHDVIDDWNTSASWRHDIEAEPWWTGRIQGGLMAYWLYQHVGNVGPTEVADRELLDAVRAAGADGGAPLRALAERADRGTADDVGRRWSYSLDLGRSRLIVLDSRNGRVLEEQDRSMLGAAEWRWLDERLTGDLDHLFVATSVPWLLPRTIHDLEAWDDELAGGAWGRIGAAVGERIRRTVDLEHWAAFGRSFHRLADALGAVARGERGRAPDSVTVLAGDVHFGYVAEADLGGGLPVRQVVSSPFRQAIPPSEQLAQRLTLRPPLSLLARALVATTPRNRPRFDWDLTHGPWFDDQLAVLTLDGPTARVRFEAAGLDADERPVLRPIAEVPLTPDR